MSASGSPLGWPSVVKVDFPSTSWPGLNSPVILPVLESYLIWSTVPRFTWLRNCEYSSFAESVLPLGAVCHTRTAITITPMTTHGSHRERGVIGRCDPGRCWRLGGSGG